MARRVEHVTIAAGASLSGEIQTDRGEIVGIILPPRWTPAKVQLMAHATSPAHPDGTFLAVVDEAAAAIDIADPTTAGTNQVQTLTCTGTPNGGTFKLSFKGVATANLNYNATAAEVKTALAALSTIGGTGNIDTAGGAFPGTPITVTFKGALMEQTNELLVLSTNALTGGTAPVVTPSETTPAVAGTIRYIAINGASKWLRCLGRVKIRSGTNASPVVQTEARVVGVVVSLDD